MEDYLSIKDETSSEDFTIESLKDPGVSSESTFDVANIPNDLIKPIKRELKNAKRKYGDNTSLYRNKVKEVARKYNTHITEIRKLKISSVPKIKKIKEPKKKKTLLGKLLKKIKNSSPKEQDRKAKEKVLKRLDKKLVGYLDIRDKLLAKDTKTLIQTYKFPKEIFSFEDENVYKEELEIIENKIEKILQDLERNKLGGKKKSKKSKKPRKHSGINQQTGRLKKGYKYSGKKLKSGLPQIIKIKR